MHRRAGIGVLAVVLSATPGLGQQDAASRSASQVMRAELGAISMTLVETDSNDAVISFGELATKETIPKEARKLFERALKADGKGDLVGAMTNLRVATEMAPAFFQAHAALAVGGLKEGDLTVAEQHAAVALALNPHYLPAREIGGLILFLRGKPRQAAELFASLLKSAPKRSTLHYFLGLALWDSGDRREAINHLRMADASPRQEARSSHETFRSRERGRPDGMNPFSAGYKSRTGERHSLPAAIHQRP